MTSCFLLVSALLSVLSAPAVGLVSLAFFPQDPPFTDSTPQPSTRVCETLQQDSGSHTRPE